MNKIVKLLPHQLKLLKSNNFLTIMLCSRGVGKTFATGALISIKLMNGLSGICVAPIYTTIREVNIPAVINFLNNNGIKYSYNKSENKITLPNGASVIFVSADNAERLRGFTEKDFMVIDEAALCDEAVYTLGIACLRGQYVRNPQVYITSTPGGSSHWTSKLARLPENTHITATIFDNHYNGEVYVKNMLREYKNLPEEFVRRELYGEITDLSSNSIFRRDEWNSIISTRNHIRNKIVMGIDVAGGGGDYSAITVINGNRIVDIKKCMTSTLDELKDFVSNMCGNHKPDIIRVDSSGIGYFIPEFLNKYFSDIDIYGINFASSCRKPYSNKRTEIYFDIKDRISNGLHFDNSINKQFISEIEEELFATKCKDRNGLIGLIEKNDIKREIHRSPDLSDSLALACFDQNEYSNTNDIIEQRLLQQKINNPYSHNHNTFSHSFK